MFLMLFCTDVAHFSEIQLVCDGWTDKQTDGPTDRRTDGQMDIPSYIDARTHQKGEKRGGMKNGTRRESESGKNREPRHIDGRVCWKTRQNLSRLKLVYTHH